MPTGYQKILTDKPEFSDVATQRVLIDLSLGKFDNLFS